MHNGGVSDGIDQYLNDESSTQADYVDPNENKGNESAISSITIKWKDDAGEEEKLERLITQKWIAM
ncbi:SusD/RagB family nutrient-binding outer membrane lipoprotein [Bacteroides ovatus]|nr:SusD/RagB family nutrient-binding outer membrane lipoprotein [Bacteroides ovatus]